MFANMYMFKNPRRVFEVGGFHRQECDRDDNKVTEATEISRVVYFVFIESPHAVSCAVRCFGFSVCFCLLHFETFDILLERTEMWGGLLFPP